MDSGFDDELRPKAGGGQRLSASVVGQGCSAVTLRHRAWLCKNRGKKQRSQWHPQKRFRLALTGWLQSTDNQLRIHTRFPGWGGFQRRAEEEEWSEARWASWPHCSFRLDMGSDGLCAHHALQYRYGVNTTRWRDLPHGCHKDLDCYLKALSLNKVWLVLVISWNLVHGPD